MDGVRRFEDLAAWRLCAQLATAVFHLTESGPVSGDFPFRDQIRAAADAAAPLIAEGFKRFTPRDLAHYLRLAYGELAEVQTRLPEGAARNYFSGDSLAPAETLARRAIRTTTNLLSAKLRQIEAEARERQQAKRRRGPAP